MKDLPIACTLDAAAMGERGARWEALAERALTGRERGPGSATLRFRAVDGVGEELRELVRLEGECCAFLDMDVAADGGELVLSIAGPTGSEELLDAFGGSALGSGGR
jgi:hypothetical protein